MTPYLAEPKAMYVGASRVKTDTCGLGLNLTATVSRYYAILTAVRH